MILNVRFYRLGEQKLVLWDGKFLQVTENS